MAGKLQIPGSGSLIQHGPVASRLEVVKGVPFQARYEETQVWHGPIGKSTRERVTGYICRDSGGRLRRDYRITGESSESLELAVIQDPSAPMVVVLDISAKVATQFTDMGPSSSGTWRLEGWGFNGPWSVKADAKERTIAGITCRRATLDDWPVAARAESGLRGEIWVSDEIKYSVLERLFEAQHEYAWRLFDIRKVEPPDTAFMIPAGFKQVTRSKFELPSTGPK